MRRRAWGAKNAAASHPSGTYSRMFATQSARLPASKLRKAAARAVQRLVEVERLIAKRDEGDR
jgi:hypothetical protein